MFVYTIFLIQQIILKMVSCRAKQDAEIINYPIKTVIIWEKAESQFIQSYRSYKKDLKQSQSAIRSTCKMSIQSLYMTLISSTQNCVVCI